MPAHGARVELYPGLDAVRGPQGLTFETPMQSMGRALTLAEVWCEPVDLPEPPSSSRDFQLGAGPIDELRKFLQSQFPGLSKISEEIDQARKRFTGPSGYSFMAEAIELPETLNLKLDKARVDLDMRETTLFKSWFDRWLPEPGKKALPGEAISGARVATAQRGWYGGRSSSGSTRR